MTMVPDRVTRVTSTDHLVPSVSSHIVLYHHHNHHHHKCHVVLLSVQDCGCSTYVLHHAVDVHAVHAVLMYFIFVFKYPVVLKMYSISASKYINGPCDKKGVP